MPIVPDVSMNPADAIQRAEAVEPASPAPIGNVHTIDLFEALNAASDTDVTYQPSVMGEDTAAQSDDIQRSPAAETPSLPRIESEPIMWQEEAESDGASVRRAVDEELLSLLHSLQSSQGTPPPTSSPSSGSAPYPAPTAVMQRQSAPPIQPVIQRQEVTTVPHIQRAITVDEMETSPSGGNKDVNVQVDRLAQDVYKMLQNRLRIERERRDR